MNDIQRTIDKYLAGETTPQEEAELARQLDIRGDIPDEWLIVREMLGTLAAGEAEYDAIMARRRKSAIARACRWAAGIAASIAIIALGLCMMPATDTATPQEATAKNNHDDKPAAAESKEHAMKAKTTTKTKTHEPDARAAAPITHTNTALATHTSTAAHVNAQPRLPTAASPTAPAVVVTDTAAATAMPTTQIASVSDDRLAHFYELLQHIQQRGAAVEQLITDATANI